MKCVTSLNAPTPGAYSQGVLVDPSKYQLLFLSGQTGNDKHVLNEPVVSGGVGPQTTQILGNLLAVVTAAGGAADSFISMRVYLKDQGDRGKARQAYDAAYQAFFKKHGRNKEKGNMPARAQVWVSEIPWENEDTLIEIEAVAEIGRNAQFL